MDYHFKSKIWLYPGKAAWHFVSLPKKLTVEIKKEFNGLTKGFGSLPVSVAIKDSSWKTSIFPDNKTQTYLLPIKSQIRKEQKLKENQTVDIRLTMII